MNMDNEEIKKMFDKLQQHVEKSIEEEKKDHKVIQERIEKSIEEEKKDHKITQEWIRKLCDRMTSTENTLDNHLINSEKKEKTKREKISYLIAGIGMVMAAISLSVNF